MMSYLFTDKDGEEVSFSLTRYKTKVQVCMQDNAVELDLEDLEELTSCLYTLKKAVRKQVDPTYDPDEWMKPSAEEGKEDQP